MLLPLASLSFSRERHRLLSNGPNQKLGASTTLPSLTPTSILPPCPAPSIPSLHLYGHPSAPRQVTILSLLPQMLPEPPEGLLALRLPHSKPPPHQGKSHASLTCPSSSRSQWDHKHVMTWSCLPLEPGLLPLFTPPCPPHTHLHSPRAVKPVLCSFLLPSFACAIPSTWNIVSTVLHLTSSS